MSSFFQFNESEKLLKARSILIDMEEGVINQIIKSSKKCLEKL
jgi:hypothetical protein